MKKYLNAFKSEIITNLIIAKNYKFSFLMDIGIFISILSFLILSKSGYKYTLYYSKNFDFRELVLIAYIMWIISLSAINTICSEIRLENIQGTLELKFMSILPFQILLLGKILSTLLIQIVEIIIVLLFTKFVFNLSIGMNFKIIGIMLLTYIGMYGFSLVVGSLILSKKKIEQLNMIIQILLLVFSNVFTISNIGFFSYLIPLGIGNHLIHLSYLGEDISNNKLLIFIFVCLLWITIGQYLFSKAINYVKEKGTLSLY